MANIYAKGYADSAVLFDFEKGCISFSRTGWANAQLGIVDMELPFDEVTGFVLKKPALMTAGEVYVVINDTILSTNTGKDFTDSYLTLICVQSAAYKKIEEAIQQFCSVVKSVPIHKKDDLTIFNKKGTINLPKAKYTKTENQYETESREFRMRCNVCGKIYYFNKADLQRNIQNAKSAKWSAVASAANAVGGTAYHAYEQGKMANSALDRIVDYSRCPNCNSTNITELTDEEFKKLSAENTQASAPTISNADELKKYKELLDMGIITQEEFDAKKKQLLGL